MNNNEYEMITKEIFYYVLMEMRFKSVLFMLSNNDNPYTWIIITVVV